MRRWDANKIHYRTIYRQLKCINCIISLMNILFKKESQIGQTIFSDCKSLEKEMHTWRQFIEKRTRTSEQDLLSPN